MYRGYIKLWRKVKDWYGYGYAYRFALWGTLLLEAAHTQTKSLFKGKPITINPGQFITGRKYLSDITGISQSQIERLLNEFEKEEMIGQQKSNRSRLITITNWDSHQVRGQQKDNRRTTEGQQKDTSKNVKNVKNIYSYSYSNNIYISKQAITKILEKQLGRMATTAQIRKVLKKVPVQMHWMVDRYLKLKYPGTPDAFEKAANGFHSSENPQRNNHAKEDTQP